MDSFPTLTKNSSASDLIRWEADDAGRFTRTSAVLTNDTGADLAEDAMGIGYPLKEAAGVWTPALTGEEASIDGVLVDERVIPAIANAAATESEYAILRRGPAVVNEGELAVNDVEDAAFVAANFVSRLNALDIQVMQAPEESETGT